MHDLVVFVCAMCAAVGFTLGTFCLACGLWMLAGLAFAWLFGGAARVGAGEDRDV